MENIKGYVFAADFGSVEHLFGKRVNESFGNYENLLTNGLAPYLRQSQAVSGAWDYSSKMKPKKIEIAKFDLSLAETSDEGKCFEKEQGLIVVMDCDFNTQKLLGPIVSGKPDFYPLPGAFLSQNGYETFRGERAFIAAHELAFQTARQGHTMARIGKLRFERLGLLF